MTTDPQAPTLFGSETPIEVLVPIIADYHYERGISVGGRLAVTWGLPLRLVHVRLPGTDTSARALNVAVSALETAHPDLVVDGVEVEAEDVAAGIEHASTDRSLIVIASDDSTKWFDTGSIGEAMLGRVHDLLLLCGARCQPPDGTAVVVPLDGSERAEAALEPALAVAAASHAKLWLITVVPPATVEAVARQREAGEHVSESGYLRSVVARLEDRGIDVGWEVLHHGEPVAGISSLARDLDSTMIVAATHGESGISKRVFGSTCLGLVERGTIPVLVVKAELDEPLPLSAGDP